MKKLCLAICLSLILTACSSVEKTETKTAVTNSETSLPTNTANTTAKTESSPAVDANAPLKFPFADFPAVETTAKAGETVLCMSFDQMAKASSNAGKDVFGTYYNQTMETPGKEMSGVKFSSGVKQVPNAYLIPIPPGAKAKKGDVVLTWHQSSSGMQRAVVVDDADPTQPTVHYIDYFYKPEDDARLTEKIKPNSFVNISGPFEPGASIAVKEGAQPYLYTVIRAAGEKVLVQNSAAFLKVLNKKDCQPVPFKVAVKAGDKVQAAFNGMFSAGTVTKVDPTTGHVFVISDIDKKERAVAYGSLLKN